MRQNEYLWSKGIIFLSNNEMLEWSKFKAYLDNDLNVAKMAKQC